MKTLIDAHSDRILGFTAFGAEAGELMGTVQLAMLAGLPYTILRDAMFAHPTMTEGLKALFMSVPQGTVDHAGQSYPGVWSRVHDEGTQIVENIANIRVPVIAAIEGRADVHSEYALLCERDRGV